MPEPKRRSLQIHLATLLILVFWVGLLQLLSHWGCNLSTRPQLPRDAVVQEWTELGFPLRTHLSVRFVSERTPFRIDEGSGTNILFDLGFWVLSVFGIAVACERHIRRGEREQPRDD
jgi:hypothetical protein